MDRRDRIMNGAAHYVAFYRKNPHLFARDYLHIRLKLFQKILLIMMMRCESTVVSASRGIGKTWIAAVFLCIRCILWPNTKAVIVSGTRGQAYNVIEKIILELRPNSPELAAEIDDKLSKSSNVDGKIVFKNGSYIKVVTAGESARGNYKEMKSYYLELFGFRVFE